MEAKSYWEKALRRKSPSTVESYLRSMNQFLDWSGLTMEGLYNLQKESLASADLRDSDEAAQLVGEYMDLMRDGEFLDKDGEPILYSNSSQNMVLKAVASFFDANKLAFDAKSLRKRRISSGVLRITKETIHELYGYSMGRGVTRTRNKAFYLFAKDSGLRVSDISALDVKDYLGAQTIEVGGVNFKKFEPFKTKKTEDYAHTVIGCESIDEIDKMLNERADGPLFLDDEGKRWRSKSMTTHMIRIRKLALGDRIRVSAHSFRKFHQTSLEGAGIPPEWVKLLQGKSAYVYSRPQDDNTLFHAYAKAYDSLRILPSQHLENQVRSLSQDMNGLRQLIIENTEITEDRLEEYLTLYRRDKAGEDILENTHPTPKKTLNPKTKKNKTHPHIR